MAGAGEQVTTWSTPRQAPQAKKRWLPVLLTGGQLPRTAFPVVLPTRTVQTMSTTMETFAMCCRENVEKQRATYSVSLGKSLD